MDRELLDRCRKVGSIIASSAKDQGSEGPLYDFRNAKTLDQFVEALERLHTRERKIVPADDLEYVLEHLERSTWRRVKSLCTLYAANNFLRSDYRSKKQAES